MDVIQSKIQKNSVDFKKNYSKMNKICEEFIKREKDVIFRDDDPSVLRHRKRNKLYVRDRIDLLLDSNSDFLEISSLAGNGMYGASPPPSCGLVAGIGKVKGRHVMIVANDATVKGGCYYPMTVKKHLRAQEIALENNLPCLYLVDSGGAFLPLQSEVFPDKEHFGRIFYNQAQMSAKGIPQISVVLGSCTAGGAYVPAMSDETVIVKEQGTIFLAGPPLVQAATGEEVTAENLGGGMVHTSISGVADYLALNDQHALEITRDIVSNLNPLTYCHEDEIKIDGPKYDKDEILGIIPSDDRKPYDIREIIARVVDASEFQEFKKNYGQTLICGFAKIMGFKVGILANNGVLFSESALKGTHFIEICNKREIPLVFLQNITGFMVGKKYEHEGIAKHGAKMVMAVSNARVPKFTVIIGGSYGAGNYGMCGRAFQPRQLWMWPNAKISVMGGEQASNVLISVKLAQLKKAGKAPDEDQINKIKSEIMKTYEEESSAYYSTARLWDDGIIDPRETRRVLGLGLAASYNKKMDEYSQGIFRM
ncbi:MAG: methylcrotonoyl-CoA carboxylase [Candidatus Cloacimonadota bacterium]|nr:MAG: methylcrotonoyl-CoA carboxylase [Candidatus Cloacimonadota bacterium]